VEKVQELDGQAGKCSELLRKVDDPPQATAIVRAECEEEFTKLKKMMRGLHTFFCVDGFPTLAWRRLGLHPYGEGGGVETEADKQIELSLRTLISNHEVIGDFRRLHSKSRGKGKHHAAEFRLWKRGLDEPGPVDGEEPGWESFVDTATPWKRVFHGADIGKRLYVAMRWEEASVSDDGEKRKGPWGPIQSVIIP
jgi:hypothetical protein